MSPKLFSSVNESAVASNDIPPAVTSQSYSYNNTNTSSDSSVISFAILIVLIIVIVWGIVKLFGNNNINERVYTADGSYIPRNSNKRGWGWSFSGLFLGGFLNNHNSSSYQNNTYNYHNSGSSGNDNYDSGSSNSFGSSDSFSASSLDSGSSFGGGGSDGGGTSGSW